MELLVVVMLEMFIGMFMVLVVGSVVVSEGVGLMMIVFFILVVVF